MQAFLHISREDPYNATMPGGRPATKSAPKFGQRLAALRGERRLTQGELAQQLGVTRDAVTYYERAGSNGRSLRKPGPTPQIAQLTERLAQLPRAQQRIVVKMLEGVLQKAG